MPSPAQLARRGLLLRAHVAGQPSDATARAEAIEGQFLIQLRRDKFHLFRVKEGRFILLLAHRSADFLRRCYPAAAVVADGVELSTDYVPRPRPATWGRR
jgi:hypothetical protein